MNEFNFKKLMTEKKPQHMKLEKQLVFPIQIFRKYFLEKDNLKI